MVKHFSKSRPKEKKLLDLDEENWGGKIKLEILNTEMDELHAKLMMREDAVDVIRNRFLAKSDRIERFDIHASEPENVRLILLPLWTVYYRYGNSIFQTVFAGWDGKAVAATEPMNLFRRAEYLAGGAGGVGGALIAPRRGGIGLNIAGLRNNRDGRRSSPRLGRRE